MPPEIPVRSKVEEITDLIIQNVSREKEFSQIAYLNLFSNRIKKIKGLEKLVGLTILVLSFNEIEQIEGITECKLLKRLDLNHNFIRKIEGLELKGNLTFMNLSNNWVSDINQIDHLRVHCSQLRELSLKCNPIGAKKSYRPTVFSRLSQLIKLDGIAQTDKDKERVKNDHVILSRELLIENLKNNNKGVVDVKQIKAGEDDHSEWERNIEMLYLNHKHISKIESLEQFVNLRKLQLMDNGIQRIEGISKCKLLEELSLEKNKITVIENISHLRYLKKLDLGRNRIKKIEGLQFLENLT